jgi:hypothetical protein
LQSDISLLARTGLNKKYEVDNTCSTHGCLISPYKICSEILIPSPRKGGMSGLNFNWLRELFNGGFF